MQDWIHKSRKIMPVFFSALLLSAAVVFYLQARNLTNVDFVNCASSFRSQADGKTLQAYAVLYLYKGKGSILISGDYSPAAGHFSPIKLVTGVEYRQEGTDLHLKIKQTSAEDSSSKLRAELQHLIPFSLINKNIDYVYEVRRQSGGDFLIKQNGTVLLYCKKITR